MNESRISKNTAFAENIQTIMKTSILTISMEVFYRAEKTELPYLRAGALDGKGENHFSSFIASFKNSEEALRLSLRL